MGAIGQQPVFLDRGRNMEPAFALRPPFGEIANIGHFATFAHSFEHAGELWRFRKPLLTHTELALERQVPESQCPVGSELRNCSGHLVEHVALRLGLPAGIGTGVDQFLHVDGNSANTDITHRDIVNLDLAAFVRNRC